MLISYSTPSSKNAALLMKDHKSQTQSTPFHFLKGLIPMYSPHITSQQQLSL